MHPASVTPSGDGKHANMTTGWKSHYNIHHLKWAPPWRWRGHMSSYGRDRSKLGVTALTIYFFLLLLYNPWRMGFSPTRDQPGNQQALSVSSGRVGAQPSYHLVPILSALSNEIWPALKENWIMGLSINSIFPSLKWHTWWKVVDVTC